MEGDVVTLQDLFVYEISGEDANGRIIGRHRSTGIARPQFWDRARYFNEEKRLARRSGRGRGARRARQSAGRALMLSPELVQLAAMALAGLAVGGVVYVLVLPYLSGERKASKRVANVAQRPRPGAAAPPRPQPLQTRRKQVQDTLKELEAKQKAEQAGAAAHSRCSAPGCIDHAAHLLSR